MKLVLVLAGVTCVLAQPALAGKPQTRAKPVKITVHPLPADFDLSQIGVDGLPQLGQDQAVSMNPKAPKGTDLREFAWDPLAFEMSLLKDGPVLGMGAIGSRKKGVPKLAHVVLDWDF